MRGTVRDSFQKPVGGVTVRLAPVGSGAPSDVVQLQSDPAGRFAFCSLRSNSYVLSAAKGDRTSSDRLVQLTDDRALTMDLVLSGGARSTGSSTGSPVGPVEFADNPKFTVAGVTDWTAVGGHGSDATLRTSEDLAKETLHLRAHDSAGQGAASKATDRAEEARLRAALAAEPQSFAANHALGEFYLQHARYQDAVPLLEAACTSRSTAPEGQYELALALQGTGDMQRAKEHVKTAIAIQDKAEFHRLAGELDEALGDPLNAVREQELAARMDPSEENYFAWGSELLLHRAIWQAQEVFKQGALAHPQSERMLTGWGAALFAGDLYTEAAQRLCEASDLAPADPEPYLNLGKVEIAAPSPLPCAEQKLARFAEQQPGNAAAAYLYAMALSKQAAQPDTAQIKSLLAKAVMLDPGCADAYLQLGILSSAQGDDTQAISYFNKALIADPQMAEAHYRLALAYNRVGQPARGAQELVLHDQLLASQAETVEKQRRALKQFSVVSQHQQSPATP